MSVSDFSKKTLPLIALFSAACLPAWAATDPVKEISDAETLREVLSATTQDGETLKATYDGYTLKIAVDEILVPVMPGAASDSNPDGVIVVAPTDVLLCGSGSVSTTLRTDGPGDLLGIGKLNYSFSNIKITGSGTGASDPDGRFAILSAASVSVKGDTVFSDRFFSANEKTSNASSGGIFYSSSALDTITLDATNGAIAFSGITVYGDTLSATNSGSSETVETQNAAAGGAVFLSGSLKIQGSDKVDFSSNKAESKDSNAFGGALYVTSSAEQPENYGVSLGAGTQVNFDNNRVVGENAQGGAAIFVGGAFKSEGAKLSFSNNKASARTGTASGGAWALASGASANLDAASQVEFFGNAAETLAECSQISGGAVYIEDSTLKSAAKNVLFSGNTALANADGTSAFGGALAVAGEKSVVEFTGTIDSVFEFSENSVSVAGAIKEKEVQDNGATSMRDFVPQALGGAIAVTDGKFTLKDVGAGTFSKNTATSSGVGTLAQGGAIYLDGSKTEAIFSTTGAWNFTENAATANGSGSARGGAVAQNAGTLKFDYSANLTFSKNAVIGAAGATEMISVSGGAIVQNGGTQSYTASGSASLVFAENTACVSAETSGSHARGAAIAQLSRNAEMQISGSATFSGNAVSVQVDENAALSQSATLAAGGAVYSTGKLTLADASFTGNTASTLSRESQAFGGAVYLSGGTFSAKALNFENNLASVHDAAGTLLEGAARGGAVYLSSGTASVSFAEFKSNSAEAKIARGGAAYLGGVFSLKNKSAFDENFVAGTNEASGGAVYLAGMLALDGGANFSGNRATVSDAGGVALGGAVYSSGTLKIEGEKTEISGNTASAENGTALGGAVYLSGGNVRLLNANISGNSATGTTAQGGAVYIDASGNASTTLTLGGNTVISGNTANGLADGIAIGNGIAGSDVLSKNATLKIASGATFSTTTDAAGNEVTTRDTFETVTLADPLRVSLNGADFTLEKTADGGDFVWGGNNEVNVASADVDGAGTGGKFTLAFRSGKTTLAEGFALTGTAATHVEIDAGAELIVSSGATFCNFDSMTLDGKLDVSGAVNFANSKISLGNAAELIFNDGTSSDVSGQNTISGLLTTCGNVAFNAVPPGEEQGVSLAIDNLLVEKSGNVTFAGTSPDIAFSVMLDGAYFAESGSLTLEAGTTLSLKSLNAIDPEKSLNIAVDGAGKLVLLDATTENNTIAFNSYYDSENKKLIDSNFTVGAGIQVEGGIFVSSGTALDLGGLSYENVVIDGGTISASGTLADSPLKIKTLSIKSSATVGDGKTTQFIELLDSVDSDNVATKQTIALSGVLKIQKDATLIAKLSLQNYASAGLSGEGTLRGDVAGSGNISVAKLDGNVTVNSADRTTFSGTTLVTGNISNTGRITLSKGAYLSTQGVFQNEVAGRVSSEGEVRLSGEIANAGTLNFTGNSVIESGSRFVQTNAGSLVLESGASVDFSKISGIADAISLEGTMVVDPSDYAAGEEFTGLFGLQSGQLDNLKITDAASNVLTDRFVWNDALGSYIFLGLNGRRIETTLYGDLVRENVFRLYDFMRAGLEHGKVASIRPSVFGEKKETSRYMRKYLERKNRFNQSDEKPAVPAPVEESAPGDFGRAADALMDNLWVQAQYGHTNASADGEHLDYGIHAWSTLLGTSFATSKEDEIGAVFGYNCSRMKHSGENAHKIDIDAYELMGFYRHVGESYDGTLALSGAYATNDSERGNAEADFNSWQVGALAEGGVTFRPESWCEIRPFTSLRIAYSRTDSFRETGSDDAFELDAADTLAARASFGFGIAFLPFDSTQISLRAAWNLDFGNSVISADAYQHTTRSDLSLSSRELERSSFDLGAYLNYRLSDSLSLYTGYTGVLRSGHEEHRADVGVNFAF